MTLRIELLVQGGMIFTTLSLVRQNVLTGESGAMGPWSFILIVEAIDVSLITLQNGEEIFLRTRILLR